MLRFLRRLPGRTARGVLALVFLAAVLLVAVTRTQVGRDALARRIEAEFAEAFDGTLRIGRLTGNLLQQFVATDILVSDSLGRPTVRLDSVRIRSSWEDLVRRRVVVPRVTVVRPYVRLGLDPEGRPVLEGLRRTRPDSGSTDGGFLRFRSARIVLTEGRLETYAVDSLAALPDFGIGLTGAADAAVSDIRADALLDWSEGQRQIDLFDLAAVAERPALVLRKVESQVVFEDGRITINRTRLVTDGSEIEAEGTVSRSPGDGTRFDGSLVASALSFDEVRSLVPASPLAGSGAFSVRLNGSPGGLAISRLELSSRSSELLASGTAIGLPDSVDFEVSVDRMHVRAADLRALLPGVRPVGALRFDSLDASGLFAGVARLRGGTLDSLAADGTIVAGGDPGSLSATFSVDLRDALRPAASVDAETASLDLAAFGDLPSTRLTGRMELSTEGIDPLTMTGVARVELVDSRIGRRSIRRAVSNARADGPALRFDLELASDAEGWLRADGLWRRDSLGSLSADAAWGRFDAGPLLGIDSLVTRSAGRLGVLLTGTDEASLAGTVRLAVDSTVVVLADRSSVVPPQQYQLTLAPADTQGPRIRIAADALDAEVAGDVRFGAVAAVGAFWVDALAGAVRRETDKPYPGTAIDPEATLLENARDIRTSLLRGDAGSALDRLVSGGPLRLEVIANVSRPDLLSAWMPGAPSVSGRFRVNAAVLADPDSMNLALALTGDSLRVNGFRLLHPDGELRAATAFDGPVEHALDLALRLRADTVATGTLALPALDAELRFDDREGVLTVGTGRHDAMGPVRLRTGLAVLPDRNRLTIEEASLEARNYRWALTDPSTLDLFAGGLTLSDLRIESDYAEGYGSQAIAVRGSLSELPTDTLFVETDALRLEELTRFADLKPRLGGRLDGRAAFTRDGGRPLLVGDATATGFVLDGRLLGHLELESRLVPGRPEIAVGLRLSPADTAGVTWPEPPFEVRENALAVDGTLRLPSASGDDPGAWDLAVRVGRADLFFLKYIFNETLTEVSGYLTGDGTVTGEFGRPVFETAFTAREGHFAIPVTGVAYDIDGELGLTRDAVVFHRMSVRDAGGGEVIVTGNLLFNEYQYFSFDLDATLDDLLIIDTGYTDELPFYGTVRGSGTATLEGPLAGATLRIPDGVTRDDSELFIPIVESSTTTDDSFIVFADSTGQLPDLRQLARRPFILARRATVERRFLDALDMDINLFAPRGSLIHLVIDPLLGDVINAESTGRMQIRRNQGEFEIYGTLEVQGGDYLFTAGEVFVRRFIIEEGGTIEWDSDPIDARLNIPAVYRTRASRAGLDVGAGASTALIPLIVNLQITGRVLSPSVDLSLAIDRSNQNVLGDYQALEARLNNPERAAEYATSVLLTNSFQLTTDNLDSRTGEQLAFNSVSQLVSAQLNRFLNAALPNVDVSFGLLGERASDLDITYGVALRLLDERLIIRGEGVYQGSSTDPNSVAAQTLQGEFVVEVRLSPTVSVEVFFRREGDVFQSAELTNTTGAGLTYQTEFPTWRRLLRRMFGWLLPDRERDDAEEAAGPLAVR